MDEMLENLTINGIANVPGMVLSFLLMRSVSSNGDISGDLYH